MNDAMYAHPATQANLQALTARGWTFVGPETGSLAEGPSERPGRMSEPETILTAALRRLGADSRWIGRKVVVSAGPTREHLDPVRVITNPSSGRMGVALAAAARDRGAQVALVLGATLLAPPDGVDTVRVETTAEMQRAVQAALASASAQFRAAAPADYRPATTAARKRPPSAGGSPSR
jgi:phosphopantothenoylcysteine decarboxylase/phosphopantothenate--cysteine ligase